MHAERVLWSICVPSLVLIAQVIFLLERGHTDKETDVSERPTHAGGYAGVANYNAHVTEDGQMLQMAPALNSEQIPERHI